MIAGKKITLEEFLERSVKLHGDKYDYSKVVEFKNNNSKIEIYCKSCKKYFFQLVASHLVGWGCRTCAWKKPRINFEEFKRRAKEIHGDQYSYTKEYYNSFGKKTKIFCKYHNDYFEQTPTQHIHYESGCPRCYLSQTTKDIILTKEDFIRHAMEIHGEKYDYSSVVYINNNTYVEIICPIHGIFPQIPRSHIYSKAGCPSCAAHTLKKSGIEILWLDSLNIPNDSQHRQVFKQINNKRFYFDGFDPETNTVYEFNGDYFHGNPSKYQSDIINKVTHCTFGELYKRTLDKEAQIKSAGYNIISIWESDFKKQKELILSNIDG